MIRLEQRLTIRDESPCWVESNPRRRSLRSEALRERSPPMGWFEQRCPQLACLSYCVAVSPNKSIVSYVDRRSMIHANVRIGFPRPSFQGWKLTHVHAANRNRPDPCCLRPLSPIPLLREINQSFCATLTTSRRARSRRVACHQAIEVAYFPLNPIPH